MGILFLMEHNLHYVQTHTHTHSRTQTLPHTLYRSLNISLVLQYICRRGLIDTMVISVDFCNHFVHASDNYWSWLV